MNQNHPLVNSSHLLSVWSRSNQNWKKHDWNQDSQSDNAESWSSDDRGKSTGDCKNDEWNQDDRSNGTFERKKKQTILS